MICKEFKIVTINQNTIKHSLVPLLRLQNVVGFSYWCIQNIRNYFIATIIIQENFVFVTFYFALKDFVRKHKFKYRLVGFHYLRLLHLKLTWRHNNKSMIFHKNKSMLCHTIRACDITMGAWWAVSKINLCTITLSKERRTS